MKRAEIIAENEEMIVRTVITVSFRVLGPSYPDSFIGLPAKSSVDEAPVGGPKK